MSIFNEIYKYFSKDNKEQITEEKEEEPYKLLHFNNNEKISKEALEYEKITKKENTNYNSVDNSYSNGILSFDIKKNNNQNIYKNEIYGQNLVNFTNKNINSSNSKRV